MSKALYKSIVDAIPEAEKSAALAELAIARPVKSEEGKTVDGIFVDLSSVEAAFNAIKDNETVISKGEYKADYVAIAGAAGQAVADALYDAVEHLKTEALIRPWVSKALEGEGLNINDPGTLAQLEAMAGDPLNLLTAEQLAKIKAVGSDVVNDFPGLKLGHVQNALQALYRGEI